MSAKPLSEIYSQPQADDFPPQFNQAEAQAIADRRRLVAADAPDVHFPAGAVGLALSGGGIRSATFNLGVIQGLAKARLLRVADYLSTVSGGGYIGGFLGRFYTRFINRPRGAVDLIEARLSDPTSPEIRWLRQSGNYLAPSGVGDGAQNAAVYLRNFLTLQTVLGICLFGLFCFANLVRFEILPWLGSHFLSLFPASLSEYVRLPTPEDFPLNQLLRHGWGFFWSPWMVAVEAVLLLAIVPLMLAYWLVSSDKPEGFQPAALKAAIVLIAALFALGLMIFDSPSLAPVLVGTSLLGSLLYAELTWRFVRAKCPGALEHPSTRSMVRNRLTYLLGRSFELAAVAVGFALLDTAGFALYGWASARRDFATAFGELGSGLAVLYPLLRMLSSKLSNLLKSATQGKPSGWVRLLTNPFVLPIVVGVPPLLLLSLASHAVFGNGDNGWTGFIVTALALLISGLLGGRDALAFVNRSSLHSTYGARIARAYLGASNYGRQGSTGGKDVTAVDPDDDVKYKDYRPDQVGGPLHVINVCLNETVDYFSNRSFRDRHGENLAVGPAGLSVGAWWHARWTKPDLPTDTKSDVLATDPGDVPSPFRGPQPGPVGTESLSLSNWLAISGAAISPGRGQGTQLGTSLLYGMANLRTGYWWDSGLEETQRPGLQPITIGAGIRQLPSRIFRTQFVLLQEFTSRFSGPWRRLWYLSDGGFFENLATYELIRRRVPYIVTSDAGFDPKGQLSDLGNLLRLVRIDFDADIRFLDRTEIAALNLPGSVKAALGELAEVRAGADGQLRKHAALARIYYDGHEQAGGVLLYIKTGVTGDESADVLSYRSLHPEFPNDPTTDQFFDEAQWESYRKLGEHSVNRLFADPTAGFWLPRVL